MFAFLLAFRSNRNTPIMVSSSEGEAQIKTGRVDGQGVVFAKRAGRPSELA